MTSRNSCSKGLLRDGMRRNLWCTVLAALGFLMAQLLPVLMMMQRALEEQKDLKSIHGLSELDMMNSWQNVLNDLGIFLGGGNVMVKIMMITLGIVCGVAMFSYLHSRQKVDFYHALPISRTRLFVNNFSTGILCVLPSYLIVLALSIACVFGMGFGAAVDWMNIGGSIISSLILFLLVYALSALAAILCGNTIISLLLLLWLLFTPAAVYSLGTGISAKFFDTFVSGVGTEYIVLKLCPIAQYFAFDGLSYSETAGRWAGNTSALTLHMVYLLIAVLAIALCWVLFRMRKSERAGAALSFEPVKTPVKVFMCAVGGVAIGMLFNIVAGDFWFWPGVVIGVVLFHWLIQIIYAFDFREIFGKPLHLLGTLVVVIAVMLACKADVFGYDRWMPDVNQVEAVGYGSEPMLKTAENMKAVYRVAEIGVASVENREENEQETVAYQEVAFLMKNGRTVHRAYRIATNDEFNALNEQIVNSEEYKRAMWDLFTYDPTSGTNRYGQTATAEVSIYTEASFDPMATIRNVEKIEQMLETLRTEALTRPEGARPVMRLSLDYRTTGASWSDTQGAAFVTDVDVKTLALIEQISGVKPERLQAESINRVELSFYDEEVSQISVTDPADIALLLQDAVNTNALSLYKYNSAEGGDLVEYAENTSIYAIDKTNQMHIEIGYPKGKVPATVIEKYRSQAKAQSGDTPERVVIG